MLSSSQALYEYLPSNSSTMEQQAKLNAPILRLPLFSVVHCGLIEKSFLKGSQRVRQRLV